MCSVIIVKHVPGFRLMIIVHYIRPQHHLAALTQRFRAAYPWPLNYNWSKVRIFKFFFMQKNIFTNTTCSSKSIDKTGALVVLF